MGDGERIYRVIMPRGKKEQFDVIVIGGGSAGLAAAEAARAAGASVCLVEQEVLGGECPNWACVPTKAMLRAATLYDDLRHAADFGVSATGVSFSFHRLMARQQAVVAVVTGEGKRLPAWAKSRGIRVVKGAAEFVDAHVIKVGSLKLRGAAFVLATGAVDAVPPIAGIEDVRYATSRDIVTLRTLPERIAIIGGGAVGMEFATLFSLLRRKVWLFEASAHVLPREDAEVSLLAAAALRGHGARVHEATKVLSVARSGKSIMVTWQQGTKKRETVRVDVLLVAAGKRPRVAGLQLAKAGVALDDRGRLKLDGQLRTTAPHIFAAGDATSGMSFTHTAHAEGRMAGLLAAGAELASAPRSSVAVVPRVAFVSPEVASVGLTEQEARGDKKRKIAVARCPIGALSRAVVDGKRDGLLKIIVDKKTEQILGGHMIGERAGEVMHEIALAMHANIPYSQLVAMLHAFPTYSEAIPVSAAYLS